MGKGRGGGAMVHVATHINGTFLGWEGGKPAFLLQIYQNIRKVFFSPTALAGAPVTPSGSKLPSKVKFY